LIEDVDVIVVGGCGFGEFEKFVFVEELV